jgi:hypothetical protein
MKSSVLVVEYHPPIAEEAFQAAKVNKSAGKAYRGYSMERAARVSGGSGMGALPIIFLDQQQMLGAHKSGRRDPRPWNLIYFIGNDAQGPGGTP